MKETAKDHIRRFSSPEPMSGCWLWIGAVHKNQVGATYGLSFYQNRKVRAHRLSYESFNGPIPPGLYACHRCDVSLCVNPDHLFAGTHQDNVDDRERKGRNSPQQGERNANSQITAAVAALIKRELMGDKTGAAIALELGVSAHIVKDISRGKNWRDVLPEPPKENQ